MQKDKEEKKRLKELRKQQDQEHSKAAFVAVRDTLANPKFIKVAITIILFLVLGTVVYIKIFPIPYVSDRPVNSREPYSGPAPDLGKFDFGLYDSVAAFFDANYFYEKYKGYPTKVPFVVFTNKHSRDSVLVRYQYWDNDRKDVTDSVAIAPLQVVKTISRITGNGKVRPVTVFVRFLHKPVSTELRFEMSDEVPRKES